MQFPGVVDIFYFALISTWFIPKFCYDFLPLILLLFLLFLFNLF